MDAVHICTHTSAHGPQHTVTQSSSMETTRIRAALSLRCVLFVLVFCVSLVFFLLFLFFVKTKCKFLEKKILCAEKGLRFAAFT